MMVKISLDSLCVCVLVLLFCDSQFEYLIIRLSIHLVGSHIPLQRLFIRLGLDQGLRMVMV